MLRVRASISLALALCGAGCCAPGALAIPEDPGGVSAPVEGAALAPTAGRPYAAKRADTPRAPTLSALSVSQPAKPGTPPQVTLKLDDPSGQSVYVQVNLQSRVSSHTSITAHLGWVASGRTATVAWPKGARLAAGSYKLLVSGRDRRGETLKGGAHTALTREVLVKAEAAKPPSPPTSTSAPAPSGAGRGASTLAPAAGVPSPAQSAAEGAVFPVDGTHNFGGPENAFGAPRAGYSHQGQDILTAEGTPVLAPYAGEIESTSYQEGGAGYYAVERTNVGFSFFFAHCEAGSLAVSGGQSVSAGALICKAGETGDATAPHLDFEIWLEGWRTADGYPINPLPYLEAWETDGASG